MARGGRRQSRVDRELIPIGSIFGAREFLTHYPDEMIRLGCLTAFWSVVENLLCMVFGMLLQNAKKAEAAYYSTVNFKARCDMIRAVATQCSLNKRAKEYLGAALEALSDAADARNNLIHGLFKMEPYSGELVSVRRRTAAKKPIVIKEGIAEELERAIRLSEIAHATLEHTFVAICLPEDVPLEDALSYGLRQPSPDKS
jgi:hypothetical protein